MKAEEAPWSKALSQNAAKYAVIALGETWGRFWTEHERVKKTGGKFDRRCCSPRFRSRKRGMSFRADDGPKTVQIKGRRIRLPKIGWVRLCEAWRFGGEILECTIKHDGVRWHAAVVCEMPDVEPKDSGAVVGVDVGLRRLATVYDGESFEVVENPRPPRLRCESFVG